MTPALRLVLGSGARGLEAYRAVRVLPGNVAVCAPVDDPLAIEAAANGQLVDGGLAAYLGAFADEIIEADG